jgi:hypothetical protein
MGTFFFKESLFDFFPHFSGFFVVLFLINTVLTLDICLQHEDIVHNKLQNVVLFYKTTVIVQHHG